MKEVFLETAEKEKSKPPARKTKAPARSRKSA
jgi:hypothetical protein